MGGVYSITPPSGNASAPSGTYRIIADVAGVLTITPRPLHGAEVETYNDHRMAMSMALIGLKVPGVIIKNPGCVAKTYPGFWEDLKKLRVFLRRAKAFVTTEDFSPEVAELDSVGLETGFVSAPIQLGLFEAQVAAVSGEL